MTNAVPEVRMLAGVAAVICHTAAGGFACDIRDATGDEIVSARIPDGPDADALPTEAECTATVRRLGVRADRRVALA